jgi:ABC-type cobalamin/Fe3+-siderophores transport system ATPase subunit
VKLLYFQLDAYRVLHQLSVPFVKNAAEESTDISNNQYTLSFLVGVNGSGKSTGLLKSPPMERALNPLAFCLRAQFGDF